MRLLKNSKAYIK